MPSTNLTLRHGAQQSSLRQDLLDENRWPVGLAVPVIISLSAGGWALIGHLAGLFF